MITITLKYVTNPMTDTRVPNSLFWNNVTAFRSVEKVTSCAQCVTVTLKGISIEDLATDTKRVQSFATDCNKVVIT